MSSIFIRDGWWRSVTPRELRESSEVVESFLAGAGAASPEEVEAFARALALTQLFEKTDALEVVANVALDSMPDVFDTSSAVEASDMLERGRAFDCGLSRCLELLEPRREAVWRAAVGRFHQMLSLREPAFLRASISDDEHAAVSAEQAEKLKRKQKPFKP
jgi:hypothetical protein